MQPLAGPFYYRVVADGCMDIFFETRRPGAAGVMGFCKSYTAFSLGCSFHYTGIRFLPAALPQLFKLDASELSDAVEALEAVHPPTASFIRNGFNPAVSPCAISLQLDTYFLHLLSKTSLRPDSRFYEALYLVLKKKGSVAVETALDTGLSPRQLRRLFQCYIGDTAKTFGNVVRFQHLLRLTASAQHLRQHKPFLDAGYYDQAHFIKMFKRFYGATPTQAFRH